MASLTVQEETGPSLPGAKGQTCQEVHRKQFFATAGNIYE